MNIFILHEELRQCARYHADRHVVKMILESTQMLCTVKHMYGQKAPYKPTHRNHPCTLWAAYSLSNWLWLRGLTAALHHEYRYRFGREKTHKSAVVARQLTPPPAPDRGLTPFAQTMPEKYRIPDKPVEAYRRFYMGEKRKLAVWTGRQTPEWYI